MAWIDMVCSFRPEQGNVANNGDIVYVRMEVTNNLPWPLTNIKYELSNVTGEAMLQPQTDRTPKQIVGTNIPPAGSAVQEFVLKATAEGSAAAEMKLIWDLANTGLTYDVNGSVSFPIHPS